MSAELNQRVCLPLYYNNKDHYGTMIKTTILHGRKIAHVRLDGSTKVVRVLLADVRLVD